MTQIVLHPSVTARLYVGSPVALRPPWWWWRTRMYRHDEHGLYLLEESGAQRAQECESREMTITFGRDWDAVVLTDPPALRVLTVEVVPDCLGDPRRPWREREYLDVRVVWHEKPGPDWHLHAPGPFPWCRPGDYRLDYRAGDRHEIREMDDDDQSGFHALNQNQSLRWPLRPTIRDGQRRPIGLTGVQCMQCGQWVSEQQAVQVQVHSPRRPSRRTGGMLCERCGDLLRRGIAVDEARMLAAASLPVLAGTRVAVPRPIRREDPQARPEQHVLDAIEALVNEQLTHTRSGYDRNINQERCPVCDGGWHGLTGTGKPDSMGNDLGAAGCPGAFAAEDEVLAWRTSHPYRR